MKLEDVIKTTNFSSQKHKASLNIMYSAWWLKNILSQELKKLSLTHEQYNVLRILKGKHPVEMCVRDIGSRMIEPNSNVPRIVDRLVHKKLVNRSTSHVDKRETVINLTNTGIESLQKATIVIEKLIDGNLLLSEQDAQSLNNFLENMRVKQ